MREIDLPSPAIGGKGYHLRRIAVTAISQLEVSGARYSDGVHPQGQTAYAFFVASADGALADGLTTPTMQFSVASKTYSVAAGATAGPTLATGGSAGAVTYSTSDAAKATVNSATGVVTGVAAGTCWIIANIAANGVYRASTRRYKATITA